MERCANMPLRDFLTYFIENFIISQHFATAAGRYDGGTQRLRFTIEEEGLVSMVEDHWRPAVAPDRLFTCLSLMADCGLIESNPERTEFLAA